MNGVQGDGGVGCILQNHSESDGCLVHLTCFGVLTGSGGEQCTSTLPLDLTLFVLASDRRPRTRESTSSQFPLERKKRGNKEQTHREYSINPNNPVWARKHFCPLKPGSRTVYQHRNCKPTVPQVNIIVSFHARLQERRRLHGYSQRTE